MASKKLDVSIFDKIRLLFYNRFLLFGIIITLPLIMEMLLLEVVFIRDFIFQLFVGIIFILAGLKVYIGRIELLRNFDLCNASVVGKIVHPLHNDWIRYVLRLTLELYFENRKFKRHFYIVQRPLFHSELNYNVLVDRTKPEKFILLNSLPKKIRKSIENN